MSSLHPISGPAMKHLVATVPPIEGETLISLLVRTSEANVFGGARDLLALAGMTVSRPEFIAFGDVAAANPIARALGQDPAQIHARMHPPSRHKRDWVVFFDLTVPRRLLEAPVRRCAPAALRLSPHARAAWSLRPLGFCPETMTRLIDRCPRCGARLGWTTCRSVWRCAHCDACPVTAKPASVPEAVRDEARAAAGLLSESGPERASALAALPTPFCDWPAVEAFNAVVEFAWAETTAPDSVVEVDRKNARGCGELTPEQLVAGYRFLRDWPGSFEIYLARLYGKSKKNNKVSHLGTLARHLNLAVSRGYIGRLIREAYPGALDVARIPCRVFPTSKVGLVSRDSSITAVAAERRFGLMRAQLRRLEFASPTHLVRGRGRGGACLYSLVGLQRLSALRANTLSEKQVARLLGLPVYAIRSLLDAHLLTCEEDHDLRLIYAGELRVHTNSALALKHAIDALPEQPGGEAAPLRLALRHEFRPKAWAKAIQDLLAGRVRVRAREGSGASLERLRVSIDEIRAKPAELSDGEVAGEVSCLAAAAMLGTTQQFIAAAVRAGLLPGTLGARRSAIPLEAVRAFDQRFVLPGEARERLRCRAGQAPRQLRSLGLAPVAVVFRVNLWDRGRFEEAVSA